MIEIDKDGQQFIGKNFSDLGKAILVVGFASYFFEKLPLWIRFSFMILGAICFLFGIIIFCWKGDNK